MSMEEEVSLLQEKIKELGNEQPDGRIGVEFGVLFDATQDIFEALNGTLRAAKREKKVTFEKQKNYSSLLRTLSARFQNFTKRKTTALPLAPAV